jgi:uncharacterized protein (PEP-CTERM system associated)
MTGSGNRATGRVRRIALGAAAGLGALLGGVPVPAVAQVPFSAAVPQATGGSNAFPGLGFGTDAPNIRAPGGAGGPPGWRVTPSISVFETLTNNVNLAPSGSEQTDLITQITPAVSISGNGRRVQLNGTVAASGVLYLNEDQNNRIDPRVSLLGSVEAIERFFFIEGAASVTQTFFTPFGPQPIGLSNETNNRYTAATYRLSPYITGVFPGNVTYTVRNDNIWTNLSNAPISQGNAYTNILNAVVSSPVEPWGWQVDANRTETEYSAQTQTYLTQIARLRLLYAVTPQLQVNVVGGYESNDFPGSDYTGAVYGGGFRWRPDPLTTVAANWQERFFGSSYDFLVERRTPLSVWGINGSRGVTTTPQLLANLPAGGNVEQLLNSVFLTRIPDPVQRQTAVDQFILQRGLPQTLTSSTPLYLQQVLLQERYGATFGLLGARNSIFFNAFYVKTQAITAEGDLVPGFGLVPLNNNEQIGLSATFSHKLTAVTSMNTTAGWSETSALSPGTLVTDQYFVRVGLSTPLGPKTTGFGGVRFQWFNSNQGTFSDSTEAAVFAGLNHTF